MHGRTIHRHYLPLSPADGSVNMTSIRYQQRQRGLSLIELMIALALSSFLIIGVTQLFLDNKRTYTFQQSQSGNQENGRFALNFLEQELAKVGYRRQPNIDPIYAFPADNQSTLSGCNFSAGVAIVANSTTDLCIRYQARDPNETDCQGNALSAAEKTAINAVTLPGTAPSSAPAMFVERLTIGLGADKVSKSLLCLSSRGTTAVVTTGAGNPSSEVVPNVAALRFEYGTGPSTDRSVSAYVTSPSQAIRAVRYAFLIQSIGVGIRDNSANPVLTQWTNLYGTSDSVSDNSQTYQIARGTVTLRNLMP
ncbi:MAG: hypothetical protein GAK45_00402 [Pseudomonas citronellolis]|nr:MAG: hypothetical protein GAK45_00402 [Pseudomonas citronellolis]